jgi:ASCH domain-containing protein
MSSHPEGPVALSLKQPWAWAVLCAGKDVENRRWRSRYRGRVVIHASRTYDPAGREYLRHAGFAVPEALPRGAYVGEVTVTDCVATDECESPWGFGPWCFLLERPVLYSVPIPGRGRLGFYRVPEAVIPGLKETMP